MAAVVTREFEGTRPTSVTKMNDVVEPIDLLFIIQKQDTNTWPAFTFDANLVPVYCGVVRIERL